MTKKQSEIIGDKSSAICRKLVWGKEDKDGKKKVREDLPIYSEKKNDNLVVLSIGGRGDNSEAIIELNALHAEKLGAALLRYSASRKSIDASELLSLISSI